MTDILIKYNSSSYCDASLRSLAIIIYMYIFYLINKSVSILFFRQVRTLRAQAPPNPQPYPQPSISEE